MAHSVGNLDTSTVLPGRCFAQWRAGVDCPNEWTGVIENLGKPGYGKFCAPHIDGYQRFNPGGKGVTYKVWTRADWEASGKEQQHDAAITAGR